MNRDALRKFALDPSLPKLSGLGNWPEGPVLSDGGLPTHLGTSSYLLEYLSRELPLQVLITPRKPPLQTPKSSGVNSRKASPGVRPREGAGA